MEGTLPSLGLRGHLGGMKVREGGRKQHGSPKGSLEEVEMIWVMKVKLESGRLQAEEAIWGSESP